MNEPNFIRIFHKFCDLPFAKDGVQGGRKAPVARLLRTFGGLGFADTATVFTAHFSATALCRRFSFTIITGWHLRMRRIIKWRRDGPPKCSFGPHCPTEQYSKNFWRLGFHMSNTSFQWTLMNNLGTSIQIRISIDNPSPLSPLGGLLYPTWHDLLASVWRWHFYLAFGLGLL